MQQSCDRCLLKSHAVLALQHRLAGTTENLNLCLDCAHSLGIREEMPAIPMASEDLFERLIFPDTCVQRDDLLCPHCGTGFIRIRHAGMVGCVHCFDTFRDEVARLLPRLARHTNHTGSLPRGIQYYRRLFLTKTELGQRIELALGAEDYEAAARLRDDLHRDLE